MLVLFCFQYIDEEYEGYGQGEYMFYDSESGKWDDSACDAANSKRCVKMDCHLPVSTRQQDAINHQQVHRQLTSRAFRIHTLNSSDITSNTV